MAVVFLSVFLQYGSSQMKKSLKIAAIGVIAWTALFVIPNPFIVKDRDKGAAVVTAGAKTVGGLALDAFAHLKDRFMAAYSPPSTQKEGDPSTAKLAKALVALGEALKDPKNSAE